MDEPGMWSGDGLLLTLGLIGLLIWAARKKKG
jgi:hypothetical protein